MNETFKDKLTLEKKIDYLVEKCQEEDQQAFSQLYDLLIDKVYRYVYFKAVPSEVDDLVAISFVKIWTNIKKYKKQKVSFSAWVFKVVRNVIIDHHRFHRSVDVLEDNIKDERSEANPRHFTDLQMNSHVLKRALSELKENYQQILVMKYLNDMSNDEIAYALNKSRSTVRVLQFRAL